MELPFAGIRSLPLPLRALATATFILGLSSQTTLATTFAVTGSLYSVQFPYGDPFAGAITANSAISGTYTFDENAPDLELGVGGSYFSSGPPFGIRVTIGGITFASDALTVPTTNNFFGFDQFGAHSQNFAGPNGTTIANMAMVFTDYTQTALSSDALPLTPPRFDSAVFSIYGTFDGGAGQFSLQGTITSLTAEVPEPSGFTISALALLAFTIHLRRRPASTRGSVC
jgi:hypothetical protein